MTLTTRTATVDIRAALAAAALALALAASIVGGVVGAFVANTDRAQAPTAGDPPGVVVLESKWVEYGNDWEQRYRQMYPGNAQ